MNKQKNVGSITDLMKALDEAYGIKPNKVNAQDNVRTLFYKDYLINLVKGLFVIECDDTWSKDYMLENLILRGMFSIQDTSMGVVPLQSSVHGINVFNRPTTVIIANPVLGTFEKTIDKDCVIIYLYDDKKFKSFVPLIDIYASKLALCDSSIDVNLINSKVAYVFDCADEKQAKEVKLVYEKISRGEPAVFWSDSSGIDGTKKLNFFKTDVKNAYVADLIQDEKRAIINEFLTMIGINNSNTDKKERLITDEVNANNEEIKLSMANIYRNIKEQVAKANKMFPGINLSITIPSQDKLEQNSPGEKPEDSEVNKDELDRPNEHMGNK